VSYIDEGDMLDAALAGLKRGIELKQSEAVAKKVARWRPCKEKFIKKLARLTHIHYKLRKRGD